MSYSGGLTPSADGVSPRMVTFELARQCGAFEVEHSVLRVVQGVHRSVEHQGKLSWASWYHGVNTVMLA